MTTLLLILGHPSGDGLNITSSRALALGRGDVNLMTCSTCPVQQAGNAIVLSDGELTMVSYEDRYGLQGPPVDPALEACLPKGAAAYQFETAAAARSWYEETRPQLGLHVAYFFDNTESPMYAASGA